MRFHLIQIDTIWSTAVNHVPTTARILCAELLRQGYAARLTELAVHEPVPVLASFIRETARAGWMPVVICGPGKESRARALALLESGGLITRDQASALRAGFWLEHQRKPFPGHITGHPGSPNELSMLYTHAGTVLGFVCRSGLEPGGSAHLPCACVVDDPGAIREMILHEHMTWLTAQAQPGDCPVRVLPLWAFGSNPSISDIAAALAELLPRGVHHRFVSVNGVQQVVLWSCTSESVKFLDEALARIIPKSGPAPYPAPAQSIENAIVSLLSVRNQTLATAESCTGGLIGHRLTNVPGASRVFLGGVVAYSNDLKMNFLHVQPETLTKFGAVSEPTAAEMALGIRSATGAHYGLSVTGIAGPTGGSPQKPVGTVFIGISTPENVHVQKLYNPTERESFKAWASQKALEFLWQILN